MKKALFLIFAVIVFSVGCLFADSGMANASAETDNKVLIVYYSWSGNTKRIAERLAQTIHADIYEIRTLKPYPEDGYKTSDIAKEERRTGKLPDIADDMPDLERYGTVIIGGPIWNSYVSAPLARYLELADFNDKKVIPFSTSQGAGQDSYLEDFKALVKNPGALGIYKDIRFPANHSPEAFSDSELDEMLSGWLEDNSFREKNYSIPCVTLNSGYKMPVIGLGTWTQDNSTAEKSVYLAIKNGYRLIDTARYYGNEEGVGRGIKRAIDDGIITREEIFVTSKIMPGNYNDPDSAIEASNNALGLGYIDLMLIHQPGYNDEEVYKALERGVASGKIKSIGISNYYAPEDFERIAGNAKIIPAVVQNENHPYFQNTSLKNYLASKGVIVESWYPLGGRGHTQELFNDPEILKIAKAHGKTSAQIILRWHVQSGYVTVPGSQNPKHIAENIDIFDFSLTDEEMKIFSGLNKNRRYENW